MRCYRRLEDWAEVTFGDYLETHDLSVFNQ